MEQLVRGCCTYLLAATLGQSRQTDACAWGPTSLGTLGESVVGGCSWLSGEYAEVETANGSIGCFTSVDRGSLVWGEIQGSQTCASFLRLCLQVPNP